MEFTGAELLYIFIKTKEEDGEVVDEGDEEDEQQGLGRGIEDAVVIEQVFPEHEVDAPDAHPVETQDDDGALRKVGHKGRGV